VEFGYQLSICSSTEENHGKPWSSSPIPEASGFNSLLVSSPELKTRTPNVSFYLAVALFDKFSMFVFPNLAFLFLGSYCGPNRKIPEAFIELSDFCLHKLKGCFVLWVTQSSTHFCSFL
jgi:hypothetical protein